jgi:hypothetical protein
VNVAYLLGGRRKRRIHWTRSCKESASNLGHRARR